MVYDYFIKDHLGNTRMTLTEEVQLIPATYMATMETEYRQWETDDSQGLGFGHINDNNTEVNSIANNTQDQFNELIPPAPNRVLRTNGSYSHLRIGATKLIKVMTDDVVRVEAYAQNPNTTDNGGSLSTITGAILGTAFGGIPGGAGTDGAIYDLFTNNFAQISTGLLSQGSPDTHKPKAYLNWILFDEDFDVVNSGTGFSQVGNGSSIQHLTSPTITVQSSGYFYIYVSNESTNTIYFDDVRLEHTRGQILQEDHYYPFGLGIAALSSQAPLSKPNKYNTFQGQERTEDFDLGWYQFKWRNHDPTIARFFNVDPLAESFYYNSPYAFSENKVTNHIELEGLEAVEAQGDGDGDDDHWFWGTIAFFFQTLENNGRAINELKGNEESSDEENLQTGAELLMFSLLPSMENAYFYSTSGFIEGSPNSSGGTRGVTRNVAKKADDAVEIIVDAARYPETAKHIDDAIAAGHPATGRINRAGTSANRRASLKNHPTRKGYDRDEYPMAVMDTGGEGASVRYISPGDNRGAGASVGYQIRELADGTMIRIVTTRTGNGLQRDVKVMKKGSSGGGG